MPYKNPDDRRAYEQSEARMAKQRERDRSEKRLLQRRTRDQSETARQKNREKQRRYALKHPEKMRAIHHARYHADPKKVKEKLQVYRAANKEKIRVQERGYKLVHRKEAIVNNAKRRARKLGLPYTFTVAEEIIARTYFHHACAVCGNEEGFEWTIALDHWIPLSSDNCPGTIATNIIPLCHGMGGCNNSKSTKEPEIWLVQRFGKRKGAQILAKIHAYIAVVTKASGKPGPSGPGGRGG